MSIKKTATSFIIGVLLCGFVEKPPKKNETPSNVPFVWENANVYFLLTDRFNNGDRSNDVNFDRNATTGSLRGFEGGDFRGIIQKIEDGYFTDLGINVLWFSPISEQIHGVVDEGTGKTYGYHGYWAKDWTRIDPNFGTETEFAELVKKAHANNIRILLDVVMNHTGPATSKDPAWGDDWVRTSPTCQYDTYNSTINCTLVDNLPDIKTESNTDVKLPVPLIEKWSNEGRLKQEIASLDTFFNTTGYPRSPRYYLIKWLTDWVRKYGIDGYRIDTAKHTEEDVWKSLWDEAIIAFAQWKHENPDEVLDENEFYSVGEVYGYGISGGRIFTNGNVDVDYFNHGMNGLINFEMKVDASSDYETIFSKYSQMLHGTLKGKTVLNYLTSHDDGAPFDKERKKPLEAATKLLLCPGASQVYYGDETSRSLQIDGTMGDATLRSVMNWEQLESNASINGYKVNDILTHWQKLGKFRSSQPSVGAGVHTLLSEQPYVFKREYKNNGYINKVVVALDVNKGEKTISVDGVFPNGTIIKDFYSNQTVKVQNGSVVISSDATIVLLGM